MMNNINIIELIILIWIMCALFNGYSKGVVLKLAHLVVIVISVAASYTIAVNITKHIKSDFTSGITFFVGFLVAFIVIDLILRHFINVMKIIDDVPVVGMINHILGAIVGGAIAIAVIFVICNIAFDVIPHKLLVMCGLTKKAVKRSILLSLFVK